MAATILELGSSGSRGSHASLEAEFARDPRRRGEAACEGLVRMLMHMLSCCCMLVLVLLMLALLLCQRASTFPNGFQRVSTGLNGF